MALSIFTQSIEQGKSRGFAKGKQPVAVMPVLLAARLDLGGQAADEVVHRASNLSMRATVEPGLLEIVIQAVEQTLEAVFAVGTPGRGFDVDKDTREVLVEVGILPGARQCMLDGVRPSVFLSRALQLGVECNRYGSYSVRG